MMNDTSLMKAENETPQVRTYDLEDRTHAFSKNVRALVRKIPHTLANQEDARQLIKSSGSVCANYMETSAAVSKKDFLYRMKVCRKEAKESAHWLDCLFLANNEMLEQARQILLKEAMSLVKIFAASIRTLQNR